MYIDPGVARSWLVDSLATLVSLVQTLVFACGAIPSLLYLAARAEGLHASSAILSGAAVSPGVSSVFSDGAFLGATLNFLQPF